jgi:hypothetical protein
VTVGLGVEVEVGLAVGDGTGDVALVGVVVGLGRGGVDVGDGADDGRQALSATRQANASTSRPD